MFVYKLFLFLFCRWVCLSSCNSWSSMKEVGTLGDVISRTSVCRDFLQVRKYFKASCQFWLRHTLYLMKCVQFHCILFCFGYVFSSGCVWVSSALNIFKCILLNENVWIPIKISLKFVPKGLLNNIPVLDKIMSWHRPGAKPLSESMIFLAYQRVYAHSASMS